MHRGVILVHRTDLPQVRPAQEPPQELQYSFHGDGRDHRRRPDGAIDLRGLACVYLPILMIGDRVLEYAAIFDEHDNLLDLGEFLA